MGVAAPLAEPEIRERPVTRGVGLVLALAVLAFAVLLSLAVGARSIPLGDVVDILRSGGDSKDAAVVLDVRVPRTLLGLTVGLALGLAGALMQALTRNPLVDPGLLGVKCRRLATASGSCRSPARRPPAGG